MGTAAGRHPTRRPPAPRTHTHIPNQTNIDSIYNFVIHRIQIDNGQKVLYGLADKSANIRSLFTTPISYYIVRISKVFQLNNNI